MKWIISSLVLALFCTGFIYAQEVPDSQPQPEIQWDVNKEYDEEGNIIRFDSTYSLKWSFPGFDEALMDSLGHRFPMHFPWEWDEGFFGSIPFGEHIFPDPFIDDPFFKDFFPEEFFKYDSSAYRHFAFPHLDHLFPGMDDMMKRQMEIMEEFLQQYDFPADSIEFENQDWYVPPGRKKSVKQIEI